MPHKIISVDSDSPVYGRVLPGDGLVNVCGKIVLDVLDYEFYTYDADITLALERDGKLIVLRVLKNAGESLGLTFETYLMDGERSCANNCVFCFIDQNPKGMRSSIYYKDDDARLSFLTGNYITLTNVGERELQRIVDLRISPINISVHATNSEIRAKMLRNARAGDILSKMRMLAEGGIRMNCQIVCCPGYNDGAALEQTLRELDGLGGVVSLSVVPVGLTAHRASLAPLVPVDGGAAREIIGIVEDFRKKSAADGGNFLVCCADELYLKAGLEIPAEEYYGEYPQLENGVGMLRLFESEFLDALKGMGKSQSKGDFSIVTGQAAAPFLKKLLRAAGFCDNIDNMVRPVRNDFFGGGVDVSGLVTGGDIAEQLRGEKLGSRLLLPRNMLRRGGSEFLDDMTLAELERELGVPVFPVETSGDALFDTIFG